MQIKKILNNNVAIAQSDEGKECVITGKGIAYGLKPGDSIDISLIQKVFSPREKGVAEKLSRILEDIPLEHIKVCDEIINYAKGQLPRPLSDKVYLGLIDHISFSIQRHSDGVDLTTSLKWEMKRFYPDEYRIGLQALDIIEARLALRLPDDEAAFIAFHLVNAGSAPVAGHVEDSLALIRGILALVRAAMAVEFDEDSISYNRFLTHLKFFSMRVFSDEEVPQIAAEGGEMLARFRQEFPRECACVEEIARFVKEQYHHTTSDAEKTYLIIHLHSLMNR